MPCSPSELELQTNFNAISENVKILKIGPVEQNRAAGTYGDVEKRLHQVFRGKNFENRARFD